MARRRGNTGLNRAERLEKKRAILAALMKAAGDDPVFDISGADLQDIPEEYYSLTQAEMEALVNGDIEKIKDWVSNLDRRHAAWLLRLVNETW